MCLLTSLHKRGIILFVSIIFECSQKNLGAMTPNKYWRKVVMKMTKKARKGLIAKARIIFVDQDKYSEEQLLGYLRLIKIICKDDTRLLENSVMIEKLEEVIKTFPEHYQSVVRLRMIQGNVLRVVGKQMGLSAEAVRQLEEKCLKLFEQDPQEFYVAEYEKNSKAKVEILNQIKHAQKPKSDLEIKVLKLPPYIYKALTQNGVYKVDQLLTYSGKDLLSLDNIGQKGVKDIFMCLKKFFGEEADKLNIVKIEDFLFLSKDIDELGLTPTTTKCLKDAGITKVMQIYYWSVKDFKSVPKMTAFKTNNIIKNLKQHFPGWQPYNDLSDCSVEETDIYYLKLTQKTYKTLYNSGISKIGQLKCMTKEQLLAIPRLGKKGVIEIKTKVENFLS